MSIALSCEKCNKFYEMPDALAGKRARCKQCGHEFRVPTPGASRAAATATTSARPIPAPPKPSAVDDDEELLPRRPARPKPLKTKKLKEKGRGASNPGLLHWGVRLLVFGAAIFVLPLFGLQFRAVNPLGPTGQMGVGLACLAIGAFCVLGSGADLIYSVIGFAGLGAGVLVFLLVFGMKQQGPQVADSGPPGAEAAPGFPMPVPPPNFNPMPVPPPNFNPRPVPRPRFRPPNFPRPSTPPPSVPNYPTYPSNSPPPVPSSPGFPPPSSNGFPPPPSSPGFPPPPTN